MIIVWARSYAMDPKKIRIILFVSGALMAVSSAVSEYLTSGQPFDAKALVIAVGAALFAYAMKAPGTVTHAEAEDIAATRVSESQRPPPSPQWAESAPKSIVDELGASFSELDDDE